MTSSPNSTKWIQLSSLSESLANYVININPNQFIVIYTTRKRFDGFKSYKYSVETDIFNTFIECKYDKVIDNNQYFITHITFNEKDQALFVYGKTVKRHFDSIHIETQEKKSYNCEQELPYGNYFLSINNYIHIINSRNRYCISSIENNKLKILHNTFNNSESPQIRARNDAVVIYVSSKQCILLIGGYYDYDDPLTNEIWKYCLSSQKWTQVNINGEFKRFDFSAVLTSNQRYIILFGGWRYNEHDNDDYESDDIFILDMKDDNNWKIKQSKIKCPYIGNCFVARTGGVDSRHEILVIGFVKKCFKMKECKHLSIPPFYILSIIAKYFSDEMLHYIRKDKHYGIYLKHILSSLSD